MATSEDEELARVELENRRLVTLLDTVDDVLLLTAPDGRLLYANAQGRRDASDMLGQPASEAFGKLIEEMNFPESMANQARDVHSRVLQEGSVTQEVLVPLRGGARWHEQKAKVVRDREGAIEAITITSRDIHERVLAREKLAGALAFREQIIGILGHDMRNPLSAIDALSKLTLRRSDLSPDVRARLQQIEQAAQRTLEMIESLLDFTESRFRRTLKISRTPNDLHDTCRQVISELRAAHPGRTIELVVEGDGTADCDRARLAQVVSNLITNALIHGDESGPVLAKVEGMEEQVLISIINQGPPIPPDLMKVVFEPFRRRPDALERPRGLGLGLYIAQQIVAAHGGSIAVSSRADTGTCFAVSVPRVAVAVAVSDQSDIS